jgi:cytochrome c
MADAPPPPRTGRLAAVALLLGVAVIAAGLLLRTRPEPEPVVAAEPAPAADPQPVGVYMARADLGRGEEYFRRCAPCHTITPGGPHSIGPNLWGVMGQPVATRPDYRYSTALREKGGSWDWETTSRFLQSPRAFAPGTKMTFAGVRDPQDRADAMLYLNSLGGSLPPPAAAR